MTRNGNAKVAESTPIERRRLDEIEKAILEARLKKKSARMRLNSIVDKQK